MTTEQEPDARWMGILAEFDKDPPKSALQTLNKGGTQLTYLDNNYVMRRANELFGVDGWDRHVVTAPYRLYESTGQRDNSTPDHRHVYACVVRITIVGDHGALLIREGTGTCDQMGPGSAAAEMAIKGADSDAMKRAFATLGKTFGLGLKKGADVEPPAKELNPEKAAVKAFAKALYDAEFRVPDGDGVLKPNFTVLVDLGFLEKLTQAGIHDLCVEHTIPGLIKLIQDKALAKAQAEADKHHDEQQEETSESD